ncbi:endonuclease V [Nocardioides sp. CCNWLW239]|uniref:endonuclease V n=1 Tax=Nocardioides sp. CCNWLW239 TaxID=3128902 RepID=UPI003018F8A7
MGTRFGATDVDYPAVGGAHAALLVSASADFATIDEQHTSRLDDVADYVPGRFYERELPAIQAVLAIANPLDVLIVDGYVDLDPAGRAGLGRHVWEAGLAAAVIGVAKTRFRAATHATPVLRGISAKPLYVTAAGMTQEEAADLVGVMAGDARIPDALRLVDRLARGRAPADWN